MTVLTVATVQLTVLLPAIAALVGLLVRRTRALGGLVATAAALAVLALGVVQLSFTAGTSVSVPTVGPLATGELGMPLDLLADRTSAVIAVAVGIVGLAVQVFSIWYLRDDPRYAVFAATVSLFVAGMLLVVQSSDLVLTLVGWEVMGWCSYLLIGHTNARESARRAAYKAFLVTRVADIGFVLGLVILAVGARSTDLTTVISHWGGSTGLSMAPFTSTTPALTAALVLLLVGVAGKSGLVPFHDWLPDAMEGPTPASALIHAATMVAAGTYVVARLHPLYAIDDTSRTVLGVLAALTMLWAGALAFAQSDVKRMLAYSTISQVAIMISGLAFALEAERLATGAALGHLFSHAMFKSLLFLAIGWLSVLGGGTAFVALRGRARGRGALQWSIGLGLAALAGVPPLVGFFSKEGVLAVAEDSLGSQDGGLALFLVVALLLTIVLTAAYCTRAWLLLTTEQEGGLAAAESEEGESESVEEAAPAGDDLPTSAHAGRPITVGAAVTVSMLAVLTVFGALLLVPIGGVHVGVVVAVLSVLLVVGTFVGVRALSGEGRDALDRVPARLTARAEGGFGVDAVYLAVGRAVVATARLVVRLDRDVVDAYPRSLVILTRAAGRAGERAHRGAPSTGLLAVVVGIVAVAVAGVTVWR